jgi:hypothetical protein
MLVRAENYDEADGWAVHFVISGCSKDRNHQFYSIIMQKKRAESYNIRYTYRNERHREALPECQLTGWWDAWCTTRKRKVTDRSIQGSALNVTKDLRATSFLPQL